MASTKKATESISNQANTGLWGFTIQSENWNGRLAMIGFLGVALIELFSGQGFLHFWNIM